MLAIATLVFYMTSTLLGVLAVYPQSYKRYEHNVSGMRRELERIVGYKRGWLKAAGIVFALGSLTLAVLIGTIVLAA